MLRFATLSDGTQVDNPRWYRKQQATIARLDRIKNRRVKQSKRRKRAALALAKAHRKVRNQRKDFQHKLSRHLVNSYGTIVMEDLAIKNMSDRTRPTTRSRAAWALSVLFTILSSPVYPRLPSRSVVKFLQGEALPITNQAMGEEL